MPKSKRPRKKYTKPSNRDAVLRHQHCQARVEYGVWGPHSARLWCITHNTHIQWLAPEMAAKWAEALATAAGISSNG